RRCNTHSPSYPRRSTTSSTRRSCRSWGSTPESWPRKLPNEGSRACNDWPARAGPRERGPARLRHGAPSGEGLVDGELLDVRRALQLDAGRGDALLEPVLV